VFEQPAFSRLRQCRSVLLLGAGGGYDVLGAVPLFVSLRRLGITVHLGGISFAPLKALPGCQCDPGHSCLYPVHGDLANEDLYCPETWLARWLRSVHDYHDPVWAISKVGVVPLRQALQSLTERLGIDAVVLVDGGIDLILRGDETSIGTPSEDLTSLCAVEGLTGLQRLIMCVGFGTELHDGIVHAQALERMAELQRAGAYLGAASLHPATEEGAAYLAALAYVQEGQRRQRGSHVQQTVRAAMEGVFGSTGPDTWVSPLTALCWFFSLPEVAASHLFLPELRETTLIWEVAAVVRGCRQNLTVREPSPIPL
jgi:hypothetical protein